MSADWEASDGMSRMDLIAVSFDLQRGVRLGNWDGRGALESCCRDLDERFAKGRETLQFLVDAPIAGDFGRVWRQNSPQQRQRPFGLQGRGASKSTSDFSPSKLMNDNITLYVKGQEKA